MRSKAPAQRLALRYKMPLHAARQIHQPDRALPPTKITRPPVHQRLKRRLFLPVIHRLHATGAIGNGLEQLHPTQQASPEVQLLKEPLPVFLHHVLQQPPRPTARCKARAGQGGRETRAPRRHPPHRSPFRRAQRPRAVLLPAARPPRGATLHLLPSVRFPAQRCAATRLRKSGWRNTRATTPPPARCDT